MNATETKPVDWYERQDELEQGQVFKMYDGSVVKLDRRVPGDGTNWYAADWSGRGFSYEDNRIHPGDLTEKLADDYGQTAAR